MKKTISILLVLVLVISVFGVFVFAEETAEDTEIQQIDAINEEEQNKLVEDVVGETEKTDEQIQSEVGITAENAADIAKADKSIGVKQLVLNRQLLHRIKVALISTGAILKHLEAKSVDVTALKEIQAKIEAVAVTEEMTKEDFLAKLDEVKVLVKQFKDKVHELVPAEQIAEVKDAVEKEKKEKAAEIDALKEKEKKVREFFNKKKQRDMVKKMNAELKKEKDRAKTALAKEKQETFKALKDQYLGQNANKENVAKFRTEWKAKLQELKQEKKGDAQ